MISRTRLPNHPDGNGPLLGFAQIRVGAGRIAADNRAVGVPKIANSLPTWVEVGGADGRWSRRDRGRLLRRNQTRADRANLARGGLTNPGPHPSIRARPT